MVEGRLDEKPIEHASIVKGGRLTGCGSAFFQPSLAHREGNGGRLEWSAGGFPEAPALRYLRRFRVNRRPLA